MPRRTAAPRRIREHALHPARAWAPSRLRALWLLGLIVVMTLAVWSRLVYWQVIDHPQLAQLALDQYTSRVDLPSARGNLYDHNLQPLAVNTTVYSVFISPKQVTASQREHLADTLASVLGRSREEIMASLTSGKQFAYLARRVNEATAKELVRQKLDLVGLEPEQQRAYMPGGLPDTTLASNLLGFVNNAGKGNYGVEAFYNNRLAGNDGYVYTYRDLRGNEIILGNQRREDPAGGQDLVLTVDSSIQLAAEKALADGVRAAKAESGTVLIMDPHTGGIVAWADYPAYNANRFSTTEVSRFIDPAVSHLYEPGSVMKVLTLAGALDTHAITPDTSINDSGVINVGGWQIHDWDKMNHGSVSMTNVLEKSLNVGAIRAMQMEGGPAFYHYLQAFGIGAPTGIDVGGENPSDFRLDPYSKWSTSGLATASFGQGIQVNMVQMLGGVNVVANGGRYVRPHVVERVGFNGAIAAPEARQVISPEAADQMTGMMKSVVQHGSGWTARVPGFELNEAGKTGTSQMPEQGGYSADHVWASYVGFMPADHPRFTMLVVVRKPNTGNSLTNEGYYVSGPIWKRIAQDIVTDWRISPSV